MSAARKRCQRIHRRKPRGLTEGNEDKEGREVAAEVTRRMTYISPRRPLPTDFAINEKRFDLSRLESGAEAAALQTLREVLCVSHSRSVWSAVTSAPLLRACDDQPPLAACRSQRGAGSSCVGLHGRLKARRYVSRNRKAVRGDALGGEGVVQIL